MNSAVKSVYKKTIAAGQLHREENYWLKTFSGDLARSNFPYDRPKSQNIRRMESVEFKFTHDIDLKLMKLMNNSDVRLHMILTAALVVLVNKYTGNHDVVIGTPVLKQDIEADFVNTVLALRSWLHKDHMIFKDLLLQVKQAMVDANENQNYPIERLPIQLGIPFSQNEDFPLFDIVILLGNIQDKSYIEHINTNVIFSFLRTSETVDGVLEYNSFLYEAATINRIILNFINLAAEILSDPVIEITSILIMSGEEKEKLLFDFNNTACDYSKDKTIHEMFADQVEKRPDNTAIVDRDGIHVISYNELNERANRLAHRLISRGLVAGEIVGVLLERSLDMVIGMLGILKAGGAYLPIDTYYPENRIRYILEDSNVNILITKREIVQNAADEKIIDPADEGLRQCSKHNPGRISRPESLLYVIYTSGSTGKPKGVLVAHKGFANLVQFHWQLFGQNHGSHMSQVANPGFDAMAFEVWPCLIYGAALYIARNEVRVDASRLIEWFISSSINISYQPTVMALQLLKARWPGENIPLKALIAAGDSLTQRPGPGHPFRLYNLYGPTEDTVWTTWSRVMGSTAGSHLPHIGKPIANHQIYIVGANLELQPIGVPGEICIGGDGLAWGYLNQPHLTHERFVKNPWAPGKPMYRTGDRGRWLPDGNIDILGRMDQQVKIRGFRIELEEIENQLQKHEKIQDAVALVREPEKGEKYLCAYVVADDELNTAEIKEFLLMNVPSYMVPPHFVKLEQVPLTPNGKVDKKALAKMEIDIHETEYVAPRNETEKRMAHLWMELLGIEKVGVKDDFFSIGGDSIKTISLLNSVNKELNTDLEILDLYENETIEKLVLRLSKDNKAQRHEEDTEILEEMENLKNKFMKGI
jgi:amino acid adenylation domain-containing protein